MAAVTVDSGTRVSTTIAAAVAQLVAALVGADAVASPNAHRVQMPTESPYWLHRDSGTTALHHAAESVRRAVRPASYREIDGDEAEPIMNQMERVGMVTTASAGCTPLIPCSRNGHSLLFDDAHRRSILFGGAAGNGLEFHDLWSVQVDADQCCRFLELRPDGPVPLARWGHSAVLRAATHEMVVFGGRTGGNALGDVWALDLSPGRERWRACGVSGIGPTPRSGASVVYHPGHDSMVVFGGIGAEPFSDTWEFRFATMDWRRIAVAGPAPGASVECVAAYDPDGDRMLVALGRDQERFHSEVWTLAFAAGDASWDRLLPGGVSPEPRAGAASAFDARARLLYVFGGWSYPPMVFHSDLHVLDVELMAWRQIGIRGAGPSGRRLCASSLDPHSGGLVLFGGEDHWRTYVGDAWCVAVPHGLDFAPQE